MTQPTPEHKEEARDYKPSESELQTARDIVKRCGLRDGLFKGPRTLNAVETIAYALLDARRAAERPKSWQYTHERDAELINSDLFMCEAHPGLDFGHDPECPGPGMAWIIEGRAAVESLLSSRDTEIREVLEGLRTYRSGDINYEDTGKTTLHWCNPDKPCTPACLATQRLWSRLQS